MAGRKKKTDKADSPADDAVKPDENETQGDATAPDAPADAPTPEEAATPPADGDSPASTEAEPKPEAEPEPEPGPEPDPETSPEPLPADMAPALTPDPAPAPQGANGFFPMLLGGVAAAVVGFAVAKFVFPDSWPASGDPTAALSQQLSDQSRALTALKQDVARLGDGPDLTGIEAELTDQQTQIAALADRLAEVEALAARLEARPAGDGLSGAALSTYENQISTLRAELDSQRDTIAAMSANAAAIEHSAASAAQDTLRRAALTRIQTALEAGTGYASALADLESSGVDIPDALRRTATGGVASVTELLDSYPDAARAALQAARAEAGDQTGGGFTAFLRSQLGARSLEPRAGNDPDAILSRVEAAAKEGRLRDALAEIEALPASARAHLDGWVQDVSIRLAAVDAMQQLSAALN